MVNIVSLLKAAFIEVSNRPSIAEDTGTTERTSTHMLHRLLNKMTGHVEIAGQFAALALLRFPAATYSHDFWYVHIRPALSAALRVHCTQALRVDTYPTSQQEQTTFILNDMYTPDAEGLFDDDLQIGFNAPHFGLDDEDEDSSREIVRAANGMVVTTTQEEHYKFRSSALEFMSLYVYAGVVVVVTKAGSRQTSEEMPSFTDPALQPTTANRGRRANATFDFDPRHSLFATHTQRLRSKHFIPILAGAPPPKHPGPRRDDASWRQAADRFAAYVLTLHMPWDLSLGAPKYALTYETLEHWTYDLSISRNFLSLATLFWMRILAQGMSVTAKTLSTTSQYRSRKAKRWGIQDIASFDLEETTMPIDGEDDKSLATSVLNDMIAVYAKMAPAAEKTTEILNAERATRDLAIMDSCLSIPKTLPPGLPGRRDIASTLEVERIYSSWARHAPLPLVEETVTVSAPTSLAPTFTNTPTSHSNAICRDPVPHFKPSQNIALLRCINWFIQDFQHTADPHHPAPPPLHLHISGAAGTGKTTFVTELDHRLTQAVPYSVVCMAPTGIAACGLPRGMTIHTALSIAVASDTKVSNGTIKGGAILARERLKKARILIIDEISMVSPSLFVRIDARLRDWFDGSLPFGGLAVVIMGDFFQLPAIQGSLLNATPGSQAGLVFVRFERLDFNDQCRAADDPQHAARLEYFRDPGHSKYPVKASQILDHLELLSQSDVTNDATWLDAPVIVSENFARHYINKAQIVRDAIRTGQPVLTWRNVLDPRTQSLFDRAAQIHNVPIHDLLQKYPESSSYFIIGARVMLRDNLTTEKGLANGTTCVLHSITFDPALGHAAIDEEFRRVSQATPGTIVELKYRPFSVNVRLNEDISNWDPTETLDTTQVVIPLMLNKKRPREFKSLGRKTGSLCHGNNKNKTLAYYDFGFDLAYSVTYHKVQGQTLDKVILDLNGCNTSALSLAALYVGLSRVRLGRKIRILPISNDTRKRLLGLRFASSLQQWWGATTGLDTAF